MPTCYENRRWEELLHKKCTALFLRIVSSISSVQSKSLRLDAINSAELKS